MSRWFARSGAALLASLPLSILSCGSPPAPVPPPPTIHLSPADELSAWQSARAVLETRCVVCHGCYDAPCQLKLGTFEGIERGASKEQVYDASRPLPAEPTRLGIDAHGVTSWRKKGFFAVLPEGAVQKAEDSPLLRMLELKRRHPLPLGRDLSHDFTLALDREQTCASAGDFDAFAEKHPLWGMPYGLPGLGPDEEATLSTWVRAGAPHPGAMEIDAASADAIRRWEAFLNGAALKERLVARYLYEHLFLASLYFEDGSGQGSERRFFRLVRSRTPAGVAVDEIATRRPFEAPGGSPFYYRFVLRDERPLEKTHMPYPLSAARLAHWRALFFEPSYEVTALPSYDLETAANPFRAFEAIPVRARHRFLLEEAEFTLMGFIKGPVCRGQIALDVIEDRFWVAFLSPEAPWTADETRFLSKTKQYLDLPAEKGSDLVPLYWFAYEKEQRAYVDRRQQFLLDQTRGGKLVTPDLLWDGDGKNQNAALTVFRHFDSATVVKGFVGTLPKTAWVLSYPQLERIHYLLVAGFDVFGNVTHQLTTRLYMDFLRMEAEATFLMFLPEQRRRELTDFWYRGVTGKSKQSIEHLLHGMRAEPAIPYSTRMPETELFTLIQRRLGGTRSRTFELAGVTDGGIRGAFERLERERGQAASFMPETSFVSVVAGDGSASYFSILRDSAHTNVAELFHEEARRIEPEDGLTAVPGFLGAYPNALFEVKKTELDAFVAAVEALKSASDYRSLRERFGVLRGSERFWPFSDRLHLASAGASGEAPLFDYNRLDGY